MLRGRFPRDYLVDEEKFYSVGQFITETQKLHPRGANFVNGAHGMGYNSMYLPELSGFKKWHGCQAGITLLSIESNGGVKGCSALTGKFVESNIRNKSIVDIWNDPNSFAYNRKFKKEDLTGYCKECKYGMNCKGGCIETSHMLTGNLHGDPYCFYKIEQKILKRYFFFQIGIKNFILGDKQKAIDMFRYSASLYRDRIFTYWNLGRLYSIIGEKEKSIIE